MRIGFVTGCLCWALSIAAQPLPKTFRFIDSTVREVTLPFKQVHNLIVVPGWINHSDTLWLILDTGVQANLLTAWPYTDTLSLKLSRKVTVTGLGEGEPLEAWLSWDNTIRLPGLIGRQQDLILLVDYDLPLAEHMGFPIHGILGAPFFKSFDVEVDYWNEQLTLYPPGSAIPHRKMDAVRLSFYQDKPYIQAGVAAPTEADTQAALMANFLIDLGASHAVSISRHASEGFVLPSEHRQAFLGRGIGGALTGEVARIEALGIGSYCFCHPLAVYPDSLSLPLFRNQQKAVAGSIGGDIWQRFTILLSYQRETLYLRPNSQFKSPFRYNTSGLEITNPVPGLPIYTIERVLHNSPAEIAGVKPGDQIMTLNGFAAAQMSFTYVLRQLNGRPGKNLRLSLLREGQMYQVKFKLEDAI